jgi:YidC/Oxa1 family membrane protein insertase
MWNTIVLQPMINFLVALTNSLGGSFGLAVIILTVIVRLATFPLFLRQLRSTKAMQSIGPQLQELKKKYSKDQQKLQQETMKMYKQAGINPLGCIWPMLVQFPIWIALFQSIIKSLGNTPEDLLGMSKLLYAWDPVRQAIPLNESFLWLNLSSPDPYYILPLLVGGSMWIQQKMSTATAGSDPSQQQMGKMMLWMMPIMFAFLTLQFPSGLALYWVVFNVLGIVIQYRVTGWGGLATVGIFKRFIPQQQPYMAQRAFQAQPEQIPPQKKVLDGERISGDKRKDSGRGRGKGPGPTGRRQR